jgi:hypothetical protein
MDDANDGQLEPCFTISASSSMKSIFNPADPPQASRLEH